MIVTISLVILSSSIFFVSVIYSKKFRRQMDNKTVHNKKLKKDLINIWGIQY